MPEPCIYIVILNWNNAGDTIECYEGTKNGPEIMRDQFSLAGLREVESWASPSGRICKWSATYLGNSG